MRPIVLARGAVPRTKLTGGNVMPSLEAHSSVADRMRTGSHAAPSANPATVHPVDALAQRTRTIWTSGEFGRIAAGYAAGAAEFVARLELAPGEPTLDVACGTGNLAIPAARAGARVVGVDIAPNLVAAARAAAERAGVDVLFQEGDAESLPYADASYATVMSMFGVMFAARPERALDELLRVASPGGRIALATWTPGGFVGHMLRAHTALVPPPAGLPSVLEWGSPDLLRARLAPYAARIRDLTLTPRTIEFVYPLAPAGVVELFREFYGPSVRTFAALDASGRAALSGALLDLWARHDVGGSDATRVHAEYLDVRIDLA